MPVSRKRKKPSPTQSRSSSDGPVLHQMPAYSEAFRARLREGAVQYVERIPALFSTLQRLFRTHDPVGLISAVTIYGLQRSMRADGSMVHRASGLEQHHVELLQAILLSVPYEEWCDAASMPQAVQDTMEALPLLSLGFLAQRINASGDHENIQANTIAALQERIRLHTLAVRNWGYFGDVVSISKEIYAPLGETFLAYHGFAATDVVEIGRAMVDEFERRMQDWSNGMAYSLGAKTAQEMARRYLDLYPDTGPTREYLADLLPPGSTPERGRFILMPHFDLHLPEVVTFDIATVAGLTGLAPERVERVLRALSLKPGLLADQKLEHLFLANPIWLAPAVDLGDEFVVPMPQAITSHIHAILRRLGEEASALKALDAARNQYLERRLVEALRDALPGAMVKPGVTWSIGHQRFETDAIAFIDKVLIIAEAKANHLTPQGLRGAPDRIKRHVRELVIDPSIQSARLESLVWEAKAGSADAARSLAEVGIADPVMIEHVIRVSVSLDDLSVLSALEKELRDAGWVPEGHELAPMMNIADLIAVADVLDQPIAFLHYLSERGHFQRAFQLMGDELDFLGLYLATGFNLGATPQDIRLAPSGMSEAIDRYFDARDAGRTVPKPRTRLRPYFASLAKTLSTRRPPGWTIMGMHLLGAASPEEQTRLERLLAKARKAVRTRKPGMEHGAIVSVTPPLDRKASMAFFVHDWADREARNAGVEEAAARTLRESDDAECIVFARHINRWAEPYEMACVARPEPAA